MPNAALAFSASKRTLFPEAPLINVLVENDPTSQAAPMALIARPGLEDFVAPGTAPIRLMFQKQGLFDNDALILWNDTLYRVSEGGAYSTFSGTVAGDDLCVADGGLDSAGGSVVRIANGTAMYLVTGSTCVQETFPDSGNAGATSVAFLGGYWVGTETGTDFAYYIEPGGATWTALEFAAAEYAPDKLAGVVAFGDLLALLGEVTTEMWRLTGNAASPLEPAGGLKFDVGCRSIYTAVNCRGTLIYVDNDCSVRMTTGGEPAIISTNGLAEQIRRVSASALRGSFFVKDQHPCYVLTLGTEATWLYDLASQRWTMQASNDRDYWRAHLFCNIGDTVLAADAESAQVWRLDPDRRTDGADTFTVTFPAFIEVKDGYLDLANVRLDCQLGDAPRSGQGVAPLIGMTISRDQYSYGGMSYRSLGATGNRIVSPRWNAQGRLKAPFGGILIFQVSDPVGRRFSGVQYNVTT